MTARDDTQQMRLNLLKVQRNSIKNEISLLDTFIDTYDPGTQFTQLQFRHNRLTTRFAIFDQICDEITLIETSEENSARFRIRYVRRHLGAECHEIQRTEFSVLEISSARIIYGVRSARCRERWTDFAGGSSRRGGGASSFAASMAKRQRTGDVSSMLEPK